MKHIVFVLGSYYPNFSAVGACAHRVIESLASDFHITVVSIRGHIHQTLRSQVGLVDIVRVETPAHARRLNLAASTSSFNRILLKIHRATMAAHKLTSHVTIEKPLVQAYVNALHSLERQVDIVIPLVFPFESVFAALEYKKHRPEVLVFPYVFDDFVESRSLHVSALNRILKEQRHIALEQLMLEQADAVLAMHPLRAHFVQHFTPTQLEKVHFLEHPLLSPPSLNGPLQKRSVVTMSYTGSLIENVREPDYMLELLQALPVLSAVQVDFYVMGNSAHKIKNVVVNGQLSIVNHGQVNRERAVAAIMQSNILLNLGDVQGKQISSKVFEYMAAGKPIIHLAYIANDSVSTILERYPLALCLVQVPAHLQENARRCAEFIERHKHSQLAFSEVAARFPEALPSTTADLMRDLFARTAR